MTGSSRGIAYGSWPYISEDVLVEKNPVFCSEVAGKQETLTRTCRAGAGNSTHVLLQRQQLWESTPASAGAEQARLPPLLRVQVIWADFAMEFNLNFSITTLESHR